MVCDLDGVFTMTDWNPSRELTANRAAYVAQKFGLNQTADYYGVTRQTVRRWIKGESAPSQKTRLSLVTRGRRITGPLPPNVRDETGRFRRPITDARARKAITSINQVRRARAEIAMAAATNERQRRDAELAGQPLTRQEEIDLDRRLSQLARDTALNPKSQEIKTRWESFRQDYKTMRGER